MKYISLDLETTGLNGLVNQIIEIAAILDDSNPDVFEKTEIKNLPRFHAYIRHNVYMFDEVALKMNWELMRKILFDDKIASSEITDKFIAWAISVGINTALPITFAGKNFSSFDRRFLENLEGWNTNVKMHFRSFDPGEYWFNPRTDTAKPALDECARRAGMTSAKKNHDAIEDAEMVIYCLRQAWSKL